MFDFLIGKKSLPESGIYTGLIDLHSHILPDVDDGVRTMEESLSILSEYEKYGVTRVKFTPHIMENFPKNNADSLRAEFEKFKSEYQGNVEISLAAEYMLDADFYKHFDSGDVLTLFEDHILVETSYIEPPVDVVGMISEIIKRGYFVVLAHPERYIYMDLKDYTTLKNMGVLFQMNLLSVFGVYGKEVTKKAEYLLKTSAYNFLGTDIHSSNLLNSRLNYAKLSKKVISQILSVKERGDLILNERA
ncbi:MAG: CpsB/CapC family capsule biosynthesis tyrosine phosphatase [Rikenellaceae bacterium]